MLPDSELPSLVEQRVCGVENHDLPCLALWHNSNLTSEDTADLQHQDISVNNDNYPAPKNIPVPQKLL